MQHKLIVEKLTNCAAGLHISLQRIFQPFTIGLVIVNTFIEIAFLTVSKL
jgi:hypothetical protein